LIDEDEPDEDWGREIGRREADVKRATGFRLDTYVGARLGRAWINADDNFAWTRGG
jgi:hypothetical protein